MLRESNHFFIPRFKIGFSSCRLMNNFRCRLRLGLRLLLLNYFFFVMNVLLWLIFFFQLIAFFLFFKKKTDFCGFCSKSKHIFLWYFKNTYGKITWLMSTFPSIFYSFTYGRCFLNN